MYFVYRLQSKNLPNQIYTGFTNDVDKRLQFHNNGQVPHTNKYKPWELLNYFAFTDRKKALTFEKYLKSGSGRAFSAKHF